jgi:hypothetical protein
MDDGCWMMEVMELLKYDEANYNIGETKNQKKISG